MKTKAIAYSGPSPRVIFLGHQRRRLRASALLLSACMGALVAGVGCMKSKTDIVRQQPDVSPNGEREPAQAQALALDRSQILPMYTDPEYTELVAIDLPTIVRVAQASNFDVLDARQAVEASRGKFESAVGSAFPALVPTAIFNWVDGTVRATEGNLVGVGFKTFSPSIAIQWVTNPGRVIYDIVAAKRRWLASKEQERAVVLETIRLAAVQYYDLVLAQARVSAAHEGVAEAQELLRITALRLRAGTGIPADELRAQARLAERRQDMVTALNRFYRASVELSVTLHLHVATTLVPNIDELPPNELVRDDLGINDLFDIALSFRPDLESVRKLAAAVSADRKATWWGEYGPEFQLAYQYGGITGHANNVDQRDGIPNNLIVNPASSTGSFSSNPVANGLIKEGIFRTSRRSAGKHDQTFAFSDQQRATASVGWRLSLSAIGELKTAAAHERQAAIEALRLIDRVQAQVVNAAQASKARKSLIGLSQQQVTAAVEALRLTQANLRAGNATTLDVLQTQDSVTQSRLRYAEAVVSYNQAQVNLLAALGLLDTASLFDEPSTSDQESTEGPPAEESSDTTADAD